MAKTEIKQKQVTIVVLNQLGDERYTQALEQAIATVIKEYFQKGRFPYIGTKPFVFSAQAETDQKALLADTSKLRQALDTEGDVVVTLTGGLVGGQ